MAYPTEVKFSDVKTLLNYFNFIEVRSKGSHHIFRHEDGRKLTVPKTDGQKVKGIYVKQIVALLDLENWYESEEEDT